jgi:SPP1 gp7 family putative phage head morphogenesis protein
MSELERLARQFKDALEAQDEQALTRIVTTYQRIFATLQTDIDALLLEISAMTNPTTAQVAKLARFKALQAQIVEQITRFQAYLQTEIINAAALSFQIGDEQAVALLRAYFAQAGIQAQLGNLPTGSFETMVAFLQEGSPLYDRIELLAGTTADYVRNALLDGIALGKNPRTVARLIQDAFGRGLTDALRMARTAMLWAHRIATQQVYQNSDVLDGWVWFATLDDTVCPVCAAQHGTIHSLDETLNGHHNCRCAMLPYIEEFGNPIEQSGLEWYKTLSEARKKELVGVGKYQLIKDGKITLSDIIGHREDDVYGNMISVKPLKDLSN